MSEINRDEFVGYVYDPKIKGLDTTFWKLETGTATLSTVYIRNNQSAISSYLLHLFADVEFALIIPVKPTAGDVRSFGLRNPSGDTLGAIYFDITATAFTAKVVLEGGTVLSETLTFTDAWATANTKFRIRWERDEIRFYVNGTEVAHFSASPQGLPSNALALRVVNANADNMDLAYVAVRRATAII